MKKMTILPFVCALILSCGGGNKAKIEITIHPDPVINPVYEPGTGYYNWYFTIRLTETNGYDFEFANTGPDNCAMTLEFYPDYEYSFSQHEDASTVADWFGADIIQANSSVTDSFHVWMTTSRGRVLVFIYGIDEDGNEIEAEGRINLQLTN